MLPFTKKHDYYATLQVHPKAADAVIQKAYRELCKLYHPDAGGSFEQMRRLNEAYEVLRDPERRRAYDFQNGRITWRRGTTRPKASAPRRPDVGMAWWEIADPRRPLRYLSRPPLLGRNYPFERSRFPFDRRFDRRFGRVVGCIACQAEVLLVFQPERADWQRTIETIDAQRCPTCAHHAACYECDHAEARAALEVRLQVVAGCLPLPSLWRAVR